MADATATPTPRPVSIFTAHITDKGAELVVTGQHGSLAIRFDADSPTISFPDWTRGEEKYKAVCELMANGGVVGWFVEKKGETGKDDTLVFFPSKERREEVFRYVDLREPPKKQPARAPRRAKKRGR